MSRSKAARFHPNFETLEQREVPAGLTLGMNVERVTDYMAAWMFTDAMKESRPWIPEISNSTTHSFSADVNHTFPVAVDGLGWPTQLGQTTNARGEHLQQILETEMFDNLNGHYAAGVYTAWWQGTGLVRWGGDATVTPQPDRPDGTHVALLNVTPGNMGIHMQIWSMNAADPIRNVHVWMPDYQGQSFVGQVWQPGASFSPFHPLFRERLKPFTTLRFMQDEETITSQVQHWSDVRPYNYATQESGDPHQGFFQNGMAPEYMIELANENNANLWVNIPHLADNNYVKDLAQLVHDHLHPGLQVDLEWSNEVWNRAPGFLPYQWVQQQLALPQNAGVSFEQFVARQERNVFGLWSQVFADHPGQLVRVVAGFEDNPNYTARLLQNMNGEFDAVSCAAYFGPGTATLATYSAATTVDQVLNDLSASIPTTLNFLQAHDRLAAAYSNQLHRHISFLAYEGGPALEGHFQPYQAALNAASVDPRIYGIYRQFLVGAAQTGLETMTNYEYTDRNVNSPYGIYGSLNYQDQPLADAPKYRAMVDFLAAQNTPAASAPQTLSVAAPVGAAPAIASPKPAGAAVPATTLPVLLVIGNQGFYYQEYNDTRQALQQAGLRVVVAAGTMTLAQPTPHSGMPAGTSGTVMPDIALTSAQAPDYSAIIFVGGYGASEYQYAFPGQYLNQAFNVSGDIKGAANRLINDFLSAGKYVTALCHGVSVLAWARVNGQSPIAGHQVTTYQGFAPAYQLNGVTYTNQPDSWNETQNGATVFAPGAIGNPRTDSDDVWVDGQFITGQNWNSARLFGQVVAQKVLGT